MESNDSIHNFWFVFFVQFSKVYLVASLATHISYHLHTTFVNKIFWKSFLLFYTNDIVLTTWISYHLTWAIVNKNLKFLFHLIVALNKQSAYITPYRNPCQRYSNMFFNLFADVYWKVYLTAFLRVCIWSSPCIFSYIPSNA